MTRKQLERRLKSAGIPEFAEADFLFRPALELVTTPSTDEQIPVGASKRGGHPDLPPGWTWPCIGPRPISFIAQINLAAAARLWPGIPLPDIGVLSFFYDAKEQPGDNGKRPKGSLKVAWFGPVALVRTPPPPLLETQYVFHPERVTLRKTVSMGSAYDMDCTDLSPEQIDDFDQFYRGHLYPDNKPKPNSGPGNNQLLGYGFALQSSPSWSCPRRDYELLLELTSGRFGEPGEMMWGDDGVIQFMVSPRDLAARNFDRVHVVLQCF